MPVLKNAHVENLRKIKILLIAFPDYWLLISFPDYWLLITCTSITPWPQGVESMLKSDWGDDFNFESTDIRRCVPSA